MSALGEAMKGIKQLLSLQMQVDALEEAGKVQRADLKGLASDLIAVDRRLVRIETMIEMTTTGRAQPPRLEGN